MGQYDVEGESTRGREASRSSICHEQLSKVASTTGPTQKDRRHERRIRQVEKSYRRRRLHVFLLEAAFR